MPSGYPTPPDTKAEVIEAILSLVDDGKSLRQACKEVGFERKTFEKWVVADPELSSQYALAKENRADKLFEEMLSIADNVEIGTVEVVKEWGVEVKTCDMIDHRRLKVDTRKWMLGKMSPKKYGDRVAMEHTGADGGPIKTEDAMDLSKLSDDELQTLLALRLKAGGAPPVH